MTDTLDNLPQIEVTSGRVIDTTYPDIFHRFANGTQLRPAVPYSRPHHCRPVTMDVYTPAPDREAPAGGFPAIMFIHGGGWARGDCRASRPLRDFPGVLAAVAARGYVVASIDYRLAGEAIWPAQGQDVKAALRFLRKHAARFGLDPQRIACWGVSCGGHLSGVLATTAGVAGLEPLDPDLAGIDDSVQAAVSWYGGFDMETITEQAEAAGAVSRRNADMPEWWLLGGTLDKVDPAFVRTAGPVNYASATSAPMLIAVGEADTIIPPAQSLQMAEALRSRGGDVELLVLPGVGHDFAGPDAAATLAANRQALAATLAYLDRKLGVAR